MDPNNNFTSFDDFAERGHFKTIDYGIFVLLILVSLLIGLFVGFREWGKATTKDFLIGGRNMHPIPVAMSLIGGVVSALSVVGNATEMYLYGTQLALNIIGCFYGTIIVVFLVLPTLYPLELISMMQYLEMRFGSMTLKRIASLDQMLNMCLYLGICLYTPSLTLASVTNFSTSSSILILGLVCTLYISIGGVKAVVYTDVVQTSIMFIGVLAVIGVVCYDLGGIGTVFDIAQKGGRIEFFNFDPSPFVRHTFWSVQVLGLYFVVSVVGLSQPQFQRLNSVRSLKTSQRLCILFFIGLVLLWSLFYFTGIVAYATYADCDPYALKIIEKPDQIVPYLIADKLSKIPGMAGLFVAAVYGAVLSSVSSQASAFAALMWEDFISDWVWFRKNVKISPTNVTRILTAFAGLMGIGFAFLVGRLGTIFYVAYSVIGAVISPLNGLFITAISAPWVNEKGAIVGFVTAFIFNLWLVIGQFANNAGKANPLPLSTDGCPTNLSNFTSMDVMVNPSLAEWSNISTILPDSLQGDFSEKLNDTSREYWILYDTSYCYFGTIGILIVLIVSSIVSYFTGFTKPEAVNPKMVNKFCLNIYKKIYGISTALEKENSANLNGKIEEKDHVIPLDYSTEPKVNYSGKSDDRKEGLKEDTGV